MTPPLLKLAFVKGPRDGESFEYKPGSTIRIGRYVRGNEISVKDAGISSKHLCIVSYSEIWIIHDLGSSNGTMLNSESLDPDTPVTLSHGDEIKLGECTSIVVNFETDVHAEEEEEHKLPPRTRRNNKRLPVSDPDPDLPKRARATRSKVAITKEEEEEAVAVEKKGNSKARGGKKIKMEVEETPKGVEISEMKRETRSRRKIGNNVKSEDSALEEMRRPSRATRSKRKEIGGDSYMELDMVLSQARAKKKKMEQKSVVEEMEAREEGVEEDKEDETSKRVEIESGKSSLGEEDQTCSVREDGEAENLQDAIETSDGKCDEEEKAEQESMNEKNVEKVDLEKMTLGDWFKYMEVYLRKQIVDETEEMIEGMRAKALRVHQYIAEQKKAQAKGNLS